jgi:predicted glutamine amidotransferase
MCIAILNLSEKVSKSNFKNSLQANRDGFGLAWVNSQGIQVWKSMSLDVNKLYKKYESVYDSQRLGDILLHFRISTGGGVNIENTHPFHINKDLIFCHNGMIKGFGNSKENDTRQFGREILADIPENMLYYNPAIQELIEHRIGYSKLIFLNSSGETKIYGEDLGIWEEDGNWYSNDSYLDYQDYFSLKYSGECESCQKHSHNIKYVSQINADLCKDCASWFETEKVLF